jgi:hypothetical protein
MDQSPPHTVRRSQLARIAWLLNKTIDNGEYELPIETVRAHAEREEIVSYLRNELPTFSLLDFTLLKPDDEKQINEYVAGLCGNYDIYVEKRGLCLALAWIIEMMQHAER